MHVARFTVSVVLLWGERCGRNRGGYSQYAKTALVSLVSRPASTTDHRYYALDDSSPYTVLYICVQTRVAKKKKMKEEHKRRQANPFTDEGGPQKRWAWADEVKPGKNVSQVPLAHILRSMSTLCVKPSLGLVMLSR